jgi:hypothetical protein
MNSTLQVGILCVGANLFAQKIVGASTRIRTLKLISNAGEHEVRS